MSDYIKKEDAVNHFEALANSLDTFEFRMAAIGAANELRKMPSKCFAPVRHGHWDVREPMPMHDIKGNLSWGNWYVCTVCGFATTAIEGHITQYKYCPSCGARMDGGEEDE